MPVCIREKAPLMFSPMLSLGVKTLYVLLKLRQTAVVLF